MVCVHDIAVGVHNLEKGGCPPLGHLEKGGCPPFGLHHLGYIYHRAFYVSLYKSGCEDVGQRCGCPCFGPALFHYHAKQ